MSFAPRTRAQLAQALDKRGVPEHVAESVLSRFEQVGLIDDDAFAAAWVGSRHRGRGLATRALSQELRHRGVAPEVAGRALSQLDGDTERETARALVRRKLARLSGVPPEVAIRRLAGMLARKGYPAGLAFSVVRAEVGEWADEMMVEPDQHG